MRNLLIVEPSRREKREALVRSIAENADVDLYFASGLIGLFDFDWVADYGGGLLPFSYADNNLLEVVNDFSARHGLRFDGIMTYVEFAISATNALQHELKLPCISRFSDGCFRNKFKVRRLLGEVADIRQPNYVRVSNLDDVRSACASGKLQFPVVIKPTEFSGSLAARLIENERELIAYAPCVFEADYPDERLRDFMPTLERAAIIESAIAGVQYSVEAIVQHGAVCMVGITRKDVGQFNGFFYSKEHCFAAKNLSDKTLKCIYEVIEESHRVLGFENTFTNTDIRVDEGGPVILEINARIAGDVIPELIQKAGGMKLIRALPSVAFGESVQWARSDSNSLKSWYAYHINAFSEGVVGSVPLHGLDASVGCELHPEAKAGDFLVTQGVGSPLRLGYIVVNHEMKAPSAKELGFCIREAIGVYKADAGESILVLPSSESDVPEIDLVEKASWSSEQAASIDTLRQRVQLDPGATVLAFNIRTKRLVGYFTGVRLASLNIADIQPWRYYAERACDPAHVKSARNGTYVKGISLTVVPGAPKGTGTRLMEAARKHFASLGIRYMVTVGRPTGYAEARRDDISFDTYYSELMSGQRRDPTFGVFTKVGAIPIGFVEEFFDDPESGNFGIPFLHIL